MGMTYEQYWEGSPYLASAYRKAYRIRREVANEEAWIQGLYVYDAFAVVLGNAFSKRGARKLNYLERPFDIFPLSDREKKRRAQEELKRIDKYFHALQQRQRMEKKKGGD